MQPGASAHPPKARATAATQSETFARGACFAGRFDILDLVGRGAESAVYKVRDRESGVVLALKVFDEQYGSDPRRRQAFLREVELGGAIQHPNVVRILGAGESAGRSFILMEFLSGRTLAETLEVSQRFHPDEVKHLFQQMVAAVDCLHARGIVHRDIKPGNLMFASDGTLKLMDFGIARRHGDAVTVGVARGTVDYAAPEQLLGREPSASSDLFAIGAVAVELLTGQKPFRGQSQMERSTKAPPSLRTMVPGMDASLAAAIEQCMQPDASHRPASARELLRMAGYAVPATDGPIPPPVVAAPPAPAPPPAPPVPTLLSLLGDEPRVPMDVMPTLASLLSVLRRITDAGDAHDPVTPETVRLRPDGTVELTRRPNPGERDTWVISTPRFSAPELLRGETKLGEQGRTAAVLYSVGIIFYEILLGRALFRQEFRNVLRKNSDLAWMEWQVDEALQPRSLKAVIPDTPAEVSSLFEQLLAKDATKRPSSYREAEMVVHRLMSQSAPTEEIAMPLIPEYEDGGLDEEVVAPPQTSAAMKVLVALAAAIALLLAAFGAAWGFGLIAPGQ